MGNGTLKGSEKNRPSEKAMSERRVSRRKEARQGQRVADHRGENRRRIKGKQPTGK